MTDNLFCKPGKNGFINWQVKHIVEFCFEIDLSEIKKFIPTRIIPLEVRPGIGVLSFSIPKFPDGNLGCLSAFDEHALRVYIAKDFRKTTRDGLDRVPFFSTYMLSVAANSDGFLQHTYLIDKMPIYLCQNLVVENSGVEKGNYDFVVYDDRGMIADLKWTYPNFPQEQIEEKDVFIQIYLGYQGKLYYETLLASIDSFFIHQKEGNAGKLYPHPFFRGLDLSKVSSYCNFQFIALNFKQYSFYTPELLSPLKPKDFDPTKHNESDIKAFLNGSKAIVSKY